MPYPGAGGQREADEARANADADKVYRKLNPDQFKRPSLGSVVKDVFNVKAALRDAGVGKKK